MNGPPQGPPITLQQTSSPGALRPRVVFAAPAVGPVESGAILKWLCDVGHTEACANKLIRAGGSYPGCDDPGVCWCGLPDGWRTPTEAEARHV